MWLQPLLLTLQLMAVAVTIAAVTGFLGAWGASALASLGRLGNLATRCFFAAMVLAIATPMILHAAAWEATAGKFGWLIMTQTGARGETSLPFGLFGGLVACGWIHGLAGGALVAIACVYGTSRVSSAVAEQSRLDLSPLGQWWRARLPVAAPWWTVALVATAVLAATEMTVVDLYGYRTIADEFYLLFAAEPSLSSVLITSVVPLTLASAALVGWSTWRRRTFAMTPARANELCPGDSLSSGWRLLAATTAGLVLAAIVVVPLGGLLIKVGHEVTVQDGRVITSWSPTACIERLLQAPRIFAEEYYWTLLLSIATAGTALLIAWPLASLARTHRGCRSLVDLGTIILAVIPGPVVAMTIVAIFQYDVPGFQTLYQQTIVPTVIALLARGIPVAYWLMRSGYAGIDRDVLDAAALDMTWFQRLWRIDRPMLRGTWRTAFLASAIVASGDVPASLPVIPPGVSTVGTRLFGLLHSGARYQEAALAIWYVAVIILISMFLFRQRGAGRVKSH